jgi:hypothetical protein
MVDKPGQIVDAGNLAVNATLLAGASAKFAGAGGLGVDAMAVLVRQIEELHKQYVAGDNVALLDAVEFCAYAGVTMPAWLAVAYCERYEDWRRFRKRTLDEGFCVAGIRKGKRLKDQERREQLKRRVIAEVVNLQKQGLPIDRGLFDRVGEKLGIGGSTADELFHTACKELLPDRS